MIPIHTINEAPRAFGRLVKLHRLQQQHTLRSLASTADLSHTLLNKIEQGLITVSQDTYDKLTHALGVSFKQDDALNQRLLENEDAYHEAIYYQDDLDARARYIPLEKHESYFMSSLYITEYMIMKIAAHLQMRWEDPFVFNQWVHLLSQLINQFSDKQKQLYFMYRSIHHFLQGELDTTIKDAKIALDMLQPFPLAAQPLMMIGRAYSNMYQLQEAQVALTEAKDQCAQRNNFHRAMVCKTLIAINDMKRRDYTHVERALKDTLAYASKEGMYYLEEVIHLSSMLYYLLKEDYDKVTAFSADIVENKHQFYFYYMYACMKKQDNKQLKKAFNEVKKHSRLFNKTAQSYKLGIEFIEARLKFKDNQDKAYERAMQQFFDATIRYRQFIETDLIYGYLIDYYKKTRQYKKAYVLTDTMIDITKGQKK